MQLSRAGRGFLLLTGRTVSAEDSKRHFDSLNWGLYENYVSLISGDFSGNSVKTHLNVRGLGVRDVNLTLDYKKLLALMPVKLVSASRNGLAGIVAYDKCCDPKGYRSVYFSFEIEASGGVIAEKLLVNAVEWARQGQWQYRNTTTLLGGLVRVSTDTSRTYNSTLNSLPGSPVLSVGMLLNEKGYEKIGLVANGTGPIFLLIAHPTTAKVTISTLQGEARITDIQKVRNDITLVAMTVSQGTIKLGITANPELSVNPAYITVLASQAVIPEFPSSAPLTLIIALSIALLILQRLKSRGGHIAPGKNP